ncbi:hypothetical protein GCM10027187_40420 [Streptosporangium sandarakinum]|uniref:Uncharacterized protein n=1 Tax=Streptosporangium sandarakinum TaxID=1260955 RepID=A0A852V474_9ACTN|nr:hypothetical protein [Streptosporangium sandarakinum]NYF44627.1 hypothetical protein [Streptosporangium sandarakinum]
MTTTTVAALPVFTRDALADAATLLADRGWLAATDATDAADLVADAVASREVYLCDACAARITDCLTGGEIAICDHCAA